MENLRLTFDLLAGSCPLRSGSVVEEWERRRPRRHLSSNADEDSAIPLPDLGRLSITA